MSHKNKGGRPKKGPAEKLKYPVKFMLPTGDYYSLKAKADSAGLRIAEVARLAVIGVNIKPRLTPEEAGSIRQLSGMANNLNQLARQANKEGFSAHKESCVAIILEIYDLIKLVRNDGDNNKG